MSLSWLHLDPEHWACSDPRHNSHHRRYVHAAGQTVLAQGLDLLARGLDVDHGVVPRSSRSRRSFYDAFHVAPGPSSEQEVSPRQMLVDSIVREVCDPERSSTTAELGQQITMIMAPAAEQAPQTFEDVVRRYATDQYVEVLVDDIHRLQALVWALGQDDETVATQFRALYAKWTDEVAAGIDAVLESLGCRLVAPLTPALFATS
jgi:hypothetical protein